MLRREPNRDPRHLLQRDVSEIDPTEVDCRHQNEEHDREDERELNDALARRTVADATNSISGQGHSGNPGAYGWR
jgi:hypothetical protein